MSNAAASEEKGLFGVYGSVRYLMREGAGGSKEGENSG
jgi:hypothetical protein